MTQISTTCDIWDEWNDQFSLRNGKFWGWLWGRKIRDQYNCNSLGVLLTHWSAGKMKGISKVLISKHMLQVKFASLNVKESMAWYCGTASHYLSRSWPKWMWPYGVTRPQWVNKTRSPESLWNYYQPNCNQRISIQHSYTFLQGNTFQSVVIEISTIFCMPM